MNMKRIAPGKPILFLLIPLFFPALMDAQEDTASPRVVDYPAEPTWTIDLPGKVDETSGVIFHDGGIWTHNDSGGKPEIYKISPETGEIIQTVVLEGAANRDWEDICQDSSHIFVGDFGNNHGTRRDLKVYRIEKSRMTDEATCVVRTETIFFSYADQEVFANRNRNNNYDCEAMISYGDDLILFSKNWVDGRSRMYKLSKKPGIHSIQPVAEFDAAGLVTGASFCKASGMLALIGYSNWIPFVYLFNDFDGLRPDLQSAVRVDFPQMQQLQTEGICFIDEHKLAISAELTAFGKQRLFFFKLHEVINEPENTPRP
jgi:hypothetical protein